MINTFLCLVISLSVLVTSTALASEPKSKRFEFTFSKQDCFKIGFTEYPKDQERDYELKYIQAAPLPKEIKAYKQGLMISGNNHSDDLFMYAYKKVQGLKPNTLYKMDVSLEFASNASMDSTGTGGSPGDSVYVKIGALPKKPKRFLDSSNLYQLNLDKGNQELDGKDMILIGTIGVKTEGAYGLKILPDGLDKSIEAKLKNYRVRSNQKGEAWLIFGTDSGFESTSTLFYTRLRAVFKEANEF